VRGLIVDFGGVLTTNVFQSFKQFAEAEGLDRDAIKRAFKEDREALALLRRLERGELTAEEFEPLFAERIGIRGDRVDGLVERLFAGVGPEDRMLGAVKAARGNGIKTGLISNSWGGSGIHYEGTPLDELFDAVVISGDVGMHKPQPEIFELGAERVGVPAEECVFVDDLRENCAGAEAVGMTAILHRGPDSTLPELERLLGLALDPA
jgi:epoxide hydrolase-like predicted phosphatase